MKHIQIGLRNSDGRTRTVLTDVHKKGFAFITINGHTIRKNALHGTKEPPIRIATSQRDKKPRYARKITICGPSQLLYSPDEPIMGCGARLVLLALNSDVKVEG